MTLPVLPAVHPRPYDPSVPHVPSDPVRGTQRARPTALMCGIAGIYRLGEQPPDERDREIDREHVARMLRAIEYRGPDDHGLHSDGRATLGVRRLSILDVQGGHQPIADHSQRVWAVQNGEIYNYPVLRADLLTRHPLRTHTDTELLPWLWLEHGPAMVEHLNGMFAFAVHDGVDETLLLARDPLGVKPLYHAVVGDRLLFASELKAVLCHPELPRALEPDMVERYLALGFVPGARTVFRGISRLRPGCRMIVRNGGLPHIERYWAWPRFPDRSVPTVPVMDRFVDEAGARLRDSVMGMLLSDRPLGVLLSGGLDSTVLLTMLPEEIRRETRTFTIGFEGGGHHDERQVARQVALHLGTRHHESSVTMDVAAELPNVVAWLDEPCADPAAVPAHFVARAASEHVTVLLSGTGGDEVFGGYRRYRLPSLLASVGAVPRGFAALAATLLADRDQHRRTRLGERLIMVRKLLEARSRPTFVDAYLSTLEPAAPARWREAVAIPADSGRVAPGLWADLVAEIGHPPADDQEAVFAIDHLFYLPDDLLLKEDRMTMAASVEGRVPFLDPGLVAFAAALPHASRFDGRLGKRLLRRLATRCLPADIVMRPKHGFSVPIEDWLRGPLRELAGDVFASAGSGVFHMPVVRRWFDEHRRLRDRSGPLWAALSWELWWRAVGSASPERLAAGGRPLSGSRVPA